jgi:nuclear protein localization family protein 4
MLLRFRGPDGMVRITAEPADTFARLGEKVWSVLEE